MLQAELLALWIVWSAALAGLGHWVLCRLRPRAGLAEHFLAGLAASLVLSVAANLVVAVDGPVSACAWGLGAAGAWRLRRRAARLARAHGGLAWVAFGTLGWVTAGAALRAVVHPDAGLYYVSSIRLAESGPAVPGLALVNPYAALNQAFAPWSALLAVGPFDGRGWHVGGGLLAWVAACAGVGLLLRGRLVGLAAAPVLDSVAWRGLSSGSADEAVTAVGCLCALVAFASRGQGGRGALVARALVVAGLVTLKQTLVLAAPLLLLEPLWHRRRAWRLGELAAGVAAGGAALFPWLLRSVTLSGMPLYPLGLFRLEVDWAAPASLARVIHGWAWVYARRPVGRYVSREQLGPWVADWLARESTSNRMLLLPLALAALGALVMCIRARRGGMGGHGLRLGAAAGVGTAAWWLLAPDPRFGQATLWALGAVVFATSLRGALRGAERRWVGVLSLAVLAGAWVGEPLPSSRPVGEFPAFPDVGPRRTVALATGEQLPTGACFETFCHHTTDAACVAARTPGRVQEGFRRADCNPLPDR